MVMDPESAEMTKYAANAMLACRISLMNEIAKICQAVGADVNHVRMGVGSDQRIGSKFLFPGLGYGGSCFPKDIRALSHLAELHGVPPLICRAVDGVNEAQRYFFLPLLEKEFGEDLKGRTFGIWGLAFKPRTDDVREAPAIDVVRELCTRGATVKAFDPESKDTAAASFRRLGLTGVEIVEKQYEAALGVDALFICTEWSEFRSTDFDLLKETMKGRTIYDGRNLYEPESVAAEGFAYHCIGRPFITPANK
jgi:UDPglucose 6-dehydrogenase